MYDNQFIQFTDSIEEQCCCGVCLPIRNISDISFIFDGLLDRATNNMLHYVSADGTKIYAMFTIQCPDYSLISCGRDNKGYSIIAAPLYAFFAPNDVFRMRIVGKKTNLIGYKKQQVVTPQSVQSIELGEIKTNSDRINLDVRARYTGKNGVPYDCKAKVMLVIDGEVVKEVESNGYTNIEKYIMNSQGKKVRVDVLYLSYPDSADVQEYFIEINDAKIISNANIVSNLLRYVGDDNDEYSVVNYRCKNSAFGFPFSEINADISVLLPVKIGKPQYSQSDKIYTKRNGDNVVLYSEITKEYECETEYIPEEWHRKLLVALSCDYFYINGELLTKSDKYDIDWKNYLTTDCGEKLAKATFKVKANVTERNSNF